MKELDFKDRVNEIITDFGIGETAEIVGVSYKAVRDWKIKASFNVNNAIKLCHHLQVNANWLLLGTGPKYIKEGASPLGSDYTMVPKYKVYASAGDGSFINDENIGDYLPFKTNWIRWLNMDPKQLAVIKATGDSMQPTIHNGDSLLLDLERTALRDGQVFAIRLNDGLLVKRTILLPGGKVSIQSDNKTYSSFEAAQSEIQVVGLVRHISRSLG